MTAICRNPCPCLTARNQVYKPLSSSVWMCEHIEDHHPSVPCHMSGPGGRNLVPSPCKACTSRHARLAAEHGPRRISKRRRRLGHASPRRVAPARSARGVTCRAGAASAAWERSSVSTERIPGSDPSSSPRRRRRVDKRRVIISRCQSWR